MGKFDKFKGKGKSSIGNIVRINKYDSKAAVLDLISYIATANDDFEITPYFREIWDKTVSFVRKEKEKSDFYPIDDIIDEMWKSIFDITEDFIDNLESNHGIGRINVAVGGGYSSGKSSFLNCVTGLGNLLPTGVEPVSIVNTLLTYSKDAKNLIIRGKNFKNAYIRLNKDVLESIQHASKSKVYVASVLDNILIDIPRSEEYLHNVTLVDTPGYNNSASINVENGRTDSETAKEALKKADAFIWCIDIEAGTIPAKDLEIIKEILDEGEEKPYIIMFTKRDKKNIEEQKKILLGAYKIVQKNLPFQPYSIMAFSDRLEQPYLVTNNKNLELFLNYLKSKSTNLDLKKYLTDSLQEAVNKAKENLQKLNDEFEQQRLDLSKKKSELREIKNERSETFRQDKEFLKELLIDNYNELLDGLDERNNLISKLVNELSDSLKREAKWIEKSGIFSNISSLVNEYSDSLDRYNETEYPDGYNYYEEIVREEWLRFLNDKLEDDVTDVEDVSKDVSEKYEKALSGKKQTSNCMANLVEFKISLNTIASNAFDKFFKDVKSHYNGKEMSEEEKGDIFASIATDDIKQFTSALSKGVDFSVCNTAGYNPLTFAVHCGNNEMVKYLINHDVDLSIKDNRGYNAFETAVIDHYQDLCELILKKDPMLKFTDFPIDSLYSKNTFKNWLIQLS